MCEWVIYHARELNDSTFEQVLETLRDVSRNVPFAARARIVLIYDTFVCTDVSLRYFLKLVKDNSYYTTQVIDRKTLVPKLMSKN